MSNAVSYLAIYSLKWYWYKRVKYKRNFREIAERETLKHQVTNNIWKLLNWQQCLTTNNISNQLRESVENIFKQGIRLVNMFAFHMPRSMTINWYWWLLEWDHCCHAAHSSKMSPAIWMWGPTISTTLCKSELLILYAGHQKYRNTWKTELESFRSVKRRLE